MENLVVFLIIFLERIINLVKIFSRIFHNELDLTFIHVFNQQMVCFLEIFHPNRLRVALSFLTGLCPRDRNNFFSFNLIFSFCYLKRDL